MNKLQKILTGLLGVQMILAIIVFIPWGGGGGGGGALLKDFAVEDVVELTVEDNNGNTVHLVKQGDAWVIPDAGNYPVDETKITPVLEKFKNVKTNRLVTQTVASHDRLQVGTNNFLRRVVLKMKDGTENLLYLGSSGGAGAMHIRSGDQSKVYLTGELTTFEVGSQASNWIDTAYLNLTASQIQALVLQNPNGAFAFDKDAEGNWVMQGLGADEMFDSVKLTTIVNRLATLRLTKPLGTQALPEYGLDNPQAVVTMALQDDQGQTSEVVLQVGAKNPDDTYTVHASTSPYYVTVSNFSVNDLVTKAKTDFLAQPTPTPAP